MMLSAVFKKVQSDPKVLFSLSMCAMKCRHQSLIRDLKLCVNCRSDKCLHVAADKTLLSQEQRKQQPGLCRLCSPCSEQQKTIHPLTREVRGGGWMEWADEPNIHEQPHQFESLENKLRDNRFINLPVALKAVLLNPSLCSSYPHGSCCCLFFMPPRRRQCPEGIYADVM